MASPFFGECFLEQVGTELGVGVHLLQPTVLLLELLHPADHGHIHAAELAAPLVERRRADAVLAAQLRHGRTGLGLLEHGDDLAVGEAGLLHRSEEHTSELQSLMRKSYAV